jgi:hypothetical protein
MLPATVPNSDRVYFVALQFVEFAVAPLSGNELLILIMPKLHIPIYMIVPQFALIKV